MLRLGLELGVTRHSAADLRHNRRCYGVNVMRALAVLAFVSSPVWAQFSGLATPADGSVVYFASTLKLKGSSQPDHGKLFVADERGVRLFRSRDRVTLPASPPCALSAFYSFYGAGAVSRDGLTVAAGIQRSGNGCSYPPLAAGTTIVTASSERDTPGYASISPSGRQSILVVPANSRPYAAVDLFYWDLNTSVRTPITLPAATMQYESYGLPGAAHSIADDGTAIILHEMAFRSPEIGTFIVRPGADPQPFPVNRASAVAISADASRVLYLLKDSQQLRIYDLQTQDDRLVAAYENSPAAAITGITMSDDGGRVAYLRGGQIYTVQTDGSDPAAIPNDSSKIMEAVISGDGSVVYAATGDGRLVKIQIESGDQTEIIGRTPSVADPHLFPDAGMAAWVTGVALSGVSIDGTAPFGAKLGGVSVRVGEREAPVLTVSPTLVRFLIPWDVPATGPTRIVVETPAGVNSPFDFPVVDMWVGGGPRAGVIVHQNWDRMVDYGGNAPHAGEIIHVFALGLGAVSPEVPPGTVAPVAGPLSSLADPMRCDNSEVLFAGLAPGFLERVYQVDLKIGDVTGYTKFDCSIGGRESFLFLSLNVLP